MQNSNDTIGNRTRHLSTCSAVPQPTALPRAPHYGPEVDSASNRNEYQEYFLGGKGGRCVGLTTCQLQCADCLEILGASPSWNSQGLSRAVMGLLYCYHYRHCVCHKWSFSSRISSSHSPAVSRRCSSVKQLLKGRQVTATV